MAVALVTEFDVEPGDRSTAGYDAIFELVDYPGEPPPGLILHTAGFAADGVFRVFEVWNSEADAERFAADRLEPATREIAGDGGAPSRRYSYELHNIAP